MPGEMTRDLAVQMYRRMKEIRRFEERTVELVDLNEIPGVTHESVGQEATAVGVCSALNQDDAITSTHRGHGHLIAKGGQLRYMYAELMGRVTGYNKGRGGSMHIADLGVGSLGANGIVGAGVPITCGAALRFKQRRSGQVAVAFFGDGAINQGVVLESLNLAAIWDLPVIFVCENNLYAVDTRITDATRVDIHERAAGFGVRGQQIDGMDVKAVFEAASQAVERARAGEGPTLLNCMTYRYYGHFTAERFLKDYNYRSGEEMQQWLERDPVVTWRRQLVERGMATAGELDALDARIEAELEEAVAFARQGPWPEPGTALDYMYVKTYPGFPAWGWE